jgi:hypothetical protein
MTASSSALDSALVLLLSHEKTIRYAQTQIQEGEMISGKSILDCSLRQLSAEGWAPFEEVELRRTALIRDIRVTLEEIQRVRLVRRATLRQGSQNLILTD